MKVAIIGCGKLGSAYARTLVRSRFVRPEELVLVEKDDSRRSALSESFGNAEAIPSEAISSCDVIIISVKPQDFEHTAISLVPFLTKSQAVISVMAGVTVKKIETALAAHSQFVRCMPNLGVAVGKAITPYVNHPNLETQAEARIREVLLSTGEVLKLEREEQIDSVTAVSGNGPAYVFYFIESLTTAAMEVGFTREQAEKLVSVTVDGSLDVWRNGTKSLEELRKAICTPGGTAEAAFKVLGNSEWQKIMEDAVKAGLKRSQELGKA